MTGGVNNDKIKITLTEFNDILNISALSAVQKNIINSIFNRISKADEELTYDEWEAFVKDIDSNGDQKLSDAEFNKAAKQHRTGVLQQTKQNTIKNELKNLYNILLKCITFKKADAKESCEDKNYLDDLKYCMEKAIWNPYAKEEEKKDVEIFYIPENIARAKSDTPGNFYEGWVAEDAFGSQTYEEWLSNNGYEYDAEVAEILSQRAKIETREHEKRRARERAQGKKGKYYCGRALIDTLKATPKHVEPNSRYRKPEPEDSVLNDMTREMSAYQLASQMAKNPNFKELPHNIVEKLSRTTLPKGCIIIHDANYKNDNQLHPDGHAGVTDGKGGEDGGVYTCNYLDKKETHIRVFVPIKPPVDETEEI